jgi:hypothetical protein
LADLHRRKEKSEQKDATRSQNAL